MWVRPSQHTADNALVNTHGAPRYPSLLGSVVVLLCSWIWTPSQGSTFAEALAPTRVRIFNPYTATETLLPRFQHAKSVSGACWAGSLQDARHDAWRCTSGYRILDPCFTGPRAGVYLLCVSAPWSRSSLRVHLQKPLPMSFANRGAAPQGTPWALELTNGGRCMVLTGKTLTVDHTRLSYACSNGDGYGPVDRHRGQWSIVFVRPHVQKRTSVYIAVAWY